MERAILIITLSSVKDIVSEGENMRKIFVLGSINCDFVISSDRLPQAGETVVGKDFFINSGGKGANQAVACSKLGAETYLIGAVGNDVFGQICTDSLEEYGCSTKFVERFSGKTTGIASIWIAEGDNRIILGRGANYCLNENQILNILKENCRKNDILISQFEIEPKIVEKAFHCARGIGMITILNPAPVPSDGIYEKLMEYTSIIVPNKTETEILCGFPIKAEEDLHRAAVRFSEYGVEETLITLGEKGSYYFGKGYEKTEKIFSAEVIDTTAAGDTTIGALAYRLVAGYTVRESLRFCAAASAITVSRKGAQQSIPTLKEVINLLNQNNESARYY